MSDTPSITSVIAGMAGAATPIGQVSGAVTAAANLASKIIDKVTETDPQGDFITDENQITKALPGGTPDDIWNVADRLSGSAGYPLTSNGVSGTGRHWNDEDIKCLLLAIAAGNRDRKYWQATLKH